MTALPEGMTDPDEIDAWLVAAALKQPGLSSIDEVQQTVQAAIQAAEGVAARL